LRYAADFLDRPRDEIGCLGVALDLVFLGVGLLRGRKCQRPITTLVAPPSDLHRQSDKVPDQEIQDIVITANLTPRKCLGFKTPFQAILKELGKDVQIRFT
jgi:hypothetical protein